MHRIWQAIWLFCLLAAAVPSLGQKVIETVPIGSNPRWVAVNPVTNQIFVTNEDSNSITVIDGNSFNTTTIPMYIPFFAVVNSQTNKIYVATLSTFPSIAVIDGSNLTTTTVFTGENIVLGPKPMALNPVTNKIYALTNRNNLVVIDGVTESVTEVPIGGSYYPGSVAVNPVTNKIYISIEGYDSVVIVVDGSSNSVIARIPVGNVADAVELDTVNNKIYVGNTNDNTISVIDGETNTVTNTIPVQLSIYGAGIAVNEATNQVYVDGYQGVMTQVSGITNLIVGQVPVGNGPLFVELDPASNVLFTNTTSDETVTLINGGTLLTTKVQVGQGPLAMAVDAAAKRLYVAVAGNNTLAVIDGHTSLSITKTGPGKVWSGDGHINCGSACSFEYDWGVSNIYLTALPDPGYTLTSLVGCDNVVGNTCTVQVKDIQTVTATFSPANVTLSSLLFMSRGVKGGTLFVGTLALGAAAPSGGVTVSLSSSPPGLVDLPSTLYIPGGRTSMQFAVRTVRVHKPTIVQITATAGASSTTGSFVIQP